MIKRQQKKDLVATEMVKMEVGLGSNQLRPYLFIWIVFQDEGMVGASPEAAAEEQISSPAKRPRLRMQDKRKENSKEARNKQFRVEERPRIGHRPHLKTYSVPTANSQHLLQSASTVQTSFVMGESNKQAVTSSEMSRNKGNQNNPIIIPSFKENLDKPSSCNFNNGIISKEIKRSTKRKWSFAEKKLVVDYFYDFFIENQSPGTNRCKAFVQEFHDKLSGRTATQVYTFINNVLTNKMQLPEELLQFY